MRYVKSTIPQKKITICRQAHLGGNAARNLGISKSKGEFIQFLDSDDLLHPQKIEMLANILRNRADLDMVYGLDQYFRKVPGDMSVIWNMPNRVSDLDRFIADDAVWNTASPLWRKSAVEKIGDWNPSIICWQDWEYHILAICKGINYAHVPMVLQFIRDHEEFKSTNLCSPIKREESKMSAGKVVYEKMRESNYWNKQRGNLISIYFLEIAIRNKGAGNRELFNNALKFAYGAGSISFKIVIITLRLLCSMKYVYNVVDGNFYVIKNYLRKLSGYKSKPIWKTIELNNIYLPEHFICKIKNDD